MRDNTKQIFLIKENTPKRKSTVEVKCIYCGKVMIGDKNKKLCFECTRERKAERALKRYYNHK